MKRLSLSLLLLLALIVPAAAQETEMDLSLEQARTFALQHNRDLMNASLEVKKAHAQRWQTIAQMLPQASMSLDYQNMCGFQMAFGPGMAMKMDPTGTIGINVNIAINGQMVVGALLNNLAIDMQEINRKKQEINLTIDVENTYLTALAMNKTIHLLDSSKMNLEQLLKVTQGAVDAGAAEQTDADQISVQLATLENTIKSTKRNIDVIYSSLAFTIGAGPDVMLVLTDKLEDVLNVDDVVTLLNSNFDVRRNSDYQMAEKNLTMAKRNVVMAEMAYVPTLSAYYSYSAKKYFGESFNMTPPNAVGVSLAVPLWSSGNRAAAITEKKLDRREAQNTLDNTRDQLEIGYRQMRFSLINAYENFDIQSRNIDVMQRVMNSTSNKYRYGAASSFDLTNASTNLLTAHSNYIQAIITLLDAQKSLKQLLEL